MAIKFDLFENPVKEGVSSPKLHAKVITKDVVTTREIREAIHKKCTASPADVAAVITALNDELYEKLSDGYAVHLEGIGYFSLSLKCAPNINPKYITVPEIYVRSVKFTPDKELASRFKGVKFERSVDSSRHSSKMDAEEIKQKLTEFFTESSFLQRHDFQRLTGFNQSKATRYIRRLVEDGVLKNVGSKFQPVYVKNNNSVHK
ncbi:MAG: HU family DNA-binding protein [Phocaeicola sp.]|jgi:predicted histone-like DNA-binding protein|uniref:HU family DNA-binding protein n=1 Tax=Phocaeicola sp. TaxID=2773926 RepID=UPI00300F217B|nr:HU family DNA-binding protein [Bacteroides sp.]